MDNATGQDSSGPKLSEGWWMLQHWTQGKGFPPCVDILMRHHIIDGKIKRPDLFIVLASICMIEAGFVPLSTNENKPVRQIANLMMMARCDRYKALFHDLLQILKATGTLAGVKYVAIVELEEGKEATGHNDGASPQMETVDNVAASGIHVEGESDPSLHEVDRAVSIIDTSETETKEGRLTVEQSGEDSSRLSQNTEANSSPSTSTHSCAQGPLDSSNVANDVPFAYGMKIAILNFMQDGQSKVTLVDAESGINFSLAVDKFLDIPEGESQQNMSYLVMESSLNAASFSCQVKQEVVYSMLDEYKGFCPESRGFENLPCEIILEVAKHLDMRSCLKFSETCQRIHKTLDCEETWESHVKFMDQDFEAYGFNMPVTFPPPRIRAGTPLERLRLKYIYFYKDALREWRRQEMMREANFRARLNRW